MASSRTGSSRLSLPAFRSLFANNPLPMWVYDRTTLQFLEVNEAAVRRYGYSRKEFLAMRITDIRPDDDVPRLLAHVDESRPAWAQHGIWRHRLKSGRIIDVEITSHTLTFARRAAVLVVAVDISPRKQAEDALAERNRVNELRADVGVILNWPVPLRDCLQGCAEVIVRHLDAAFARIWTLNAAEQVLELQASAGMYTHLDGPHGRVPVGQFKIGMIAQERAPHLTNAVIGDPSVGDQEWAKREGMVAFAGCPLMIHDRVVGVLALFARHRLSEDTTTGLTAVAAHVALGIERHRAEEANRLLAAIVEDSNDAILSTTLDGVIHSWNAGAERLYGFSAEEALGQPGSLIVPSDRPGELRALLDTVRRGERLTHYETVRRRKDGALIPVALTVSPVRDAAGAITGASAIVRDLSERQRAETALREAEERMRFVLQACHIGIWDANLTTGNVTWSQTLEALHGLPPGTFGGTFEAFLACIHPEDRQAVRETVDRMTPQPTDSHFLYRTIWPDRTVHWIQTTGRSFSDDADRRVRTAGVAFDVTALRTLEEQYRQAHKMEAVGQLAGGVAHDFNNLLTAILGYGSLALEQLDTDHPARTDIEEIHKAAESAASLTRQLLAFSRRQMLQPRVLDLNTIVTRVESLLRRLIGEDIQLTCRLASPLARVSADPGQIEQIIMNLALNARDAMRREGKLTIETANVELDQAYVAAHPGASPGAHAMLAVSDTGIGMDEATRSRIFEPFFTTKQRGEGTGLGLATVYGIVKQSGGSIWVYSEPGRGTTFKIYLPKAAQEFDEPREAAVAPAALRGTETILVAEDQSGVRAVARAALTRQGYTVLEAGDGEEAMRIIREHREPIHLLLTDVVMPTMGGRELVTQLQHTHPEIRVLYTSGYTDDAVVRHGVLAREVAFLEKPFTPHTLVKKVREILDAPRPRE